MNGSNKLECLSLASHAIPYPVLGKFVSYKEYEVL